MNGIFRTRRATHSRSLFFFLSATALAGSVFFACGGDDSSPAASEDSGVGSDVQSAGDTAKKADAADVIDTGIDTGPACTSAPDAAMYDPGAIDAGGQIVASEGCHGCHTADLSGNPAGIGFAYPKNLTPDPTTGLGCWTDDEIARVVLTGIDDEGEQLCVMPKFQGTIDDAGVAEIVAYLRSIPAVSKVIPETTCATSDAGVDAD